ncbi:hypothetical protein GCM10028778_20880 [Barrientosiimonas marina]
MGYKSNEKKTFFTKKFIIFIIITLIVAIILGIVAVNIDNNLLRAILVVSVVFVLSLFGRGMRN